MRFALLAATMLGLNGCMASPADQLSSIQSNSNTRLTNTARLANPPQSLDADQSTIAAQAHEDVQSLNTADAPADDAADQPETVLVQPKNIAATRNSIYSSNDPGFDQQGVLGKKDRLRQNPADTVDAARTSIYANNSVEAVIAEDNAAVPSYDALAGRMAVPIPDAKEVSQVQELAMADVEIPVLDPNSSLAATQLVQTDKAAATINELASADPATPELQTLPAELAVPVVAQKEAEPEKKTLTLADLFRKSSSKNFDGDRFAKKKIATRNIPNMQTAALSDDALPGVNNANAMFPTANAAEDDEHEDEDDNPAGLMQLAALPSMTRVAPNGLFVQTDKVEVRCLRPQLVSMIKQVENHYKRAAIVTSGFRDVKRNRRAGGARHSMHTLCAAADIQVQGVSKWELADYLRSIPNRGGVGTYCHTESVHIDIGGERDWNWRCRRKKNRG